MHRFIRIHRDLIVKCNSYYDVLSTMFHFDTFPTWPRLLSYSLLTQSMAISVCCKSRVGLWYLGFYGNGTIWWCSKTALIYVNNSAIAKNLDRNRIIVNGWFHWKHRTLIASFIRKIIHLLMEFVWVPSTTISLILYIRIRDTSTEQVLLTIWIDYL